MGYTSFDASKALKAAGFERDRWPQMVWHDPRLEHWPPVKVWVAQDQRRADPERDYAAPDHLTALDWLEAQRGWFWERGTDENRTAYYYARWKNIEIESDDPDALILAICAHLAAQTATEVGS